MRKRIFVVGMFDSVHFGRWLEQFAEESLDIYLFPSTWHRRVHPIIKELLMSRGACKYTASPRVMTVLPVPLTLADRILRTKIRARILSRALRRVQPHLIHAVELQHAGYLVLDSLEINNDKQTKLFVTNYGSDIFWYRQFPEHMSRLRQLLSRANFYSCECTRDVGLATEMGFRGQVLPVTPNAGGLVIPEQMSSPSSRRIITIKGYTGFVGRAELALEAISKLSHELKDYEVVFIKSSIRLWFMARRVRNSTGVRITWWIRKRHHHQILSRLAKSRVVIGISMSDGIATNLLEAMSRGTFPIQTSTSCAEEWLDASQGEIVAPDTEELYEALKRALGSDALVDSAMMRNKEIIHLRANQFTIRDQRRSWYSNLMTSRTSESSEKPRSTS